VSAVAKAEVPGCDAKLFLRCDEQNVLHRGAENRSRVGNVIYRSGKRQSDGSVGQPRRLKYRELDCAGLPCGDQVRLLSIASRTQFAEYARPSFWRHNGRRIGDRFVGGMNQPRDLGKAFAGAEAT